MIVLLNAMIEECFTKYEEASFRALYNRLLQRAAEHFSNEKLILAKTKFPGSQIIEFSISRVIMGHMISEDTNYFPYLSE